MTETEERNADSFGRPALKRASRKIKLKRARRYFFRLYEYPRLSLHAMITTSFTDLSHLFAVKLVHRSEVDDRKLDLDAVLAPSFARLTEWELCLSSDQM